GGATPSVYLIVKQDKSIKVARTGRVGDSPESPEVTLLVVMNCNRRAICPRERTWLNAVASGSRSGDDRPRKVKVRLCADVLHTTTPVRSEKIEAQAVTLAVDLPQQSVSQCDPLCRVDFTFKYRELDTLPEVFTCFGNAAQAPLAAWRGRLHV